MVYDCVSQAELRNLAEYLSANHPLAVAGAAGLLEELLTLLVQSRRVRVRRLQVRHAREACPRRVESGSGHLVHKNPWIPACAGMTISAVSPILILSGSRHPTTKAQLQHLNKLRHPGVHVVSAPSRRLSPSAVLSTLVQQALTAIHRLQPQAVILIGGDTASHLCRALGIHHLTIEAPVSPGVVACRPTSPMKRQKGNYVPRLLLKPGGFGGPDLLVRCVRWLHENPGFPWFDSAHHPELVEGLPRE
ncbi:MAG: hypothetical protein HYZ73_01355 [Elusimicrobia bacterium]|nr:hypothetical protein [Elusimicrobiota bacterium]